MPTFYYCHKIIIFYVIMCTKSYSCLFNSWWDRQNVKVPKMLINSVLQEFTFKLEYTYKKID